VYFTTGHTIYGVSSKGKEVLKYDMNVSEKLKGLIVTESEIWVSGDYIVSSLKYTPGQKPTEKDYFLASNKINYMTIGNISGELINNPILGCQDKSIYVLKGDEVLYKVAVASPVTVLEPYEKNFFFYGCTDGFIGVVQLGRESGKNHWVVSENKSSVIALKIFEFFNVLSVANDRKERRI